MFNFCTWLLFLTVIWLNNVQVANDTNFDNASYLNDEITDINKKTDKFENLNTTNHEYLLTNREYDAFVHNENKQMPPLVHLFYVNSSEFEERETYYFRCYAISTASVEVKWMFKYCPSGNPICEGSYEQLVKNTQQDTSKTQYDMLITDVYINVNETGTLLCNASNSFGNSVEEYTITGTNIEIWPDVSELTLSSGENRIFICKGNIPVQWYFNQYDQISPIQQNSSTKLFSKSRNRYSYFSRLSLSKVSYFDIGYYYCGPSVIDIKFFEPNFKKIYVYVQDEAHLIAVPEDLKAWYVHESLYFIIPCRPTSPDVNVMLYADYTNGSSTYFKNYDRKIGYLTPTTEYTGSFVYYCNASKNDISESQVFSALINPERPQINVSGGHFDHIITGQNINLYCSINTKILFSNSFPFELHWEIKTNKSQAEHKRHYFHFDGRISLNIENVTIEDEGEYICVQTTLIGREKFRATYTLKTFSPDETYLNLSILDEDYKVIGLNHFETVQWVVQISAYPKATLEWRGPNGKKIDTNSEKFHVKNCDTLSKLVIKDVQVSDSGVYQLFSYNGAHEKNMSVTLLVEDTSNGLGVTGPPIIVVGDNVTIKCIAPKNKYLDDIKWIHHTFDNEESQIFINENVSIVNYETDFLYESNLTIKDINQTFDGTIKCVVRETRKLNKNTVETVSTVALSLKVEDLGVPIIYNSSNSSSLSRLGDSVQWWCYAHGVPPPKIVWLKDDRAMRFDENDFRVFMQNNNQTLVITVTDLEDEGYYVCNVSNGVGSVVSVSNLTFTDLREPIIYNSSTPNNSRNIGETLQLRCFVSGMPYPNITWYKNDKPLPLFNENYERVRLLNGSQILSINYIKLEDHGNYSCRVSNIVGSTESSYELVVTDPPGKYFTPTVILLYFIIFLICGSAIVVCAVKFLKLDVQKVYFENHAVKKWDSDLKVHEQVALLSYDHQWEFPRNKLKLGKQLGYGAYGVVFKAEATNIIDKNTTSTVAVKMMRINNDSSYRNGLISELKIMIYVGRHLNIVNLLGACTGSLTESRMMVIVEYCRYGNIHQYLLKKRDCFVNQVTPDDKLDYNIQTISKNMCNENYKIYRTVNSEIYDSSSSITCDRYIVPLEEESSIIHRDDHDGETGQQSLCTHDLIYWSYQIARGMEYLASRKVVHGDLAARNVLLTEMNVVKISDFGLAKTMYNSEYYKRKPDEGVVPVKWMAIESLRDHVFSTQSDIWSFGIVMWEMFSLSVTPYPNVFKFDDLFKRLIEGYRMELPKYANSKIYNMMLDCWDQEPADRPSFTDLAELLGDFLQSHTKSLYSALNEDYATMNTKRSSPANALGLLTPSTEINTSVASKINKNSILEVYERTSDDDLELTPMFNT